ncbi:glycerol-3-phosphate dehydrogenase/oxidase [Lignipirellula cremea]|uniref:Aerobic glycerol-3-phosphate dehydrogenase n=1 Tax=Lignipirellula cremea TaxID=2528010 RepID=A0A518E1G8_9BACT|nr:glycerol-3-phosphate dehydrogenase/oxidase [Lignipirellula cremea]QDU97922.1 Aerobic glycerol-3-phosphate dehydrogenase [Lignipirellula cremea]
MASSAPSRSVLILGGGINGAAIARECALNGLSVTLVDQGDLAGGATAYSSRLIHGGLRYLEYGDVALVRESLEERSRLLKLAPHLVHPLRLQIPVENRFGGLRQSVRRFFKWGGSGPAASRGVHLVQAGLWLYDQLSRSSTLPKRSVQKVGTPGAAPVSQERYRWLCAYSDAQIRYPERFVIAQLEDARRLCQQQQTTFEVLPYHTAERHGKSVQVRPLDDASGADVREFDPEVIINATGAWVDSTLARLAVDSPRLMGPTKGTHLLSFHPGLRKALGDQGIYAEADDGRPVFLLPFVGGVLIGTTDLPFEDDPGSAVATEQEIDYLLSAVERVLPQVQLTRSDVAQHYSGVRPLPRAPSPAAGGKTAAIPRGHWLQHHAAEVPIVSVIGGKLTTCRALAEEVVADLLKSWGEKPQANTRERPLPGGEQYPSDNDAVARTQATFVDQLRLPAAAIAAVWDLCGMQTRSYLEDLSPADQEPLAGSSFPRGFIRRVVDREWATTLSDLIERRLMLLYSPLLSSTMLGELADILIDAGRLDPTEKTAAIAGAQSRLLQHYGKTLCD